MEKHVEINVGGVVQGVGFRPFCYRTAVRLDLSGSVKNIGDAGVRIVLEGDEESIERFLEILENENPPLARVKEVKVEWKEENLGIKEFKILESETGRTEKTSVIPPDIGICEDCRNELMNPNDRRHHYPFISCVNCGPRFSIIKNLPYDRERTSMGEFPLCKDCRREYENPTDRRYHAQPICCSKNGPEMSLYNENGSKIKIENPIRHGAEKLARGNILAVKGIGGIHIATKSTSDQVIKKLRRKFDRPQQPLAIMARDLETVRNFSSPSEKEEEILTSNQRPITLLRKREDFPLSEKISPGLDTVGVMLPYSGIHHMLFNHGEEPAYVMTSANFSGLPMLTENSTAISELKGVVDYFLLHDRKIVNRCDDSVVKTSGGKRTFLRRSRGYTPLPIKTGRDSEEVVLALGGELDSTISVFKDGNIYPSQYIGDVENLETLQHLERTIKRFSKLLQVEDPDVVACDLHPEFITTRKAQEMTEKTGAELVQVQHHKAHLYSLMAEHGLEEMVGIAADGTGYGEDGTSWGGEIITITRSENRRKGGLSPYRLPGGDLAAKYPARSFAGILWEGMDRRKLKEILNDYCQEWLENDEAETILQQLKSDINAPITTSAGRLLDSISCLLGVCGKRTYEGEPAIKLEAFARRGDADEADLELPLEKTEEKRTLDVTKLLKNIIAEKRNGTDEKDIAASAQAKLAEGLSKIAIATAREEKIKNIGISGGIFYNDAITQKIKETVEKTGFKLYQHEKLPPGDGNVSAGQAFSAIFGEK